MLYLASVLFMCLCDNEEPKGRRRAETASGGLELQHLVSRGRFFFTKTSLFECVQTLDGYIYIKNHFPESRRGHRSVSELSFGFWIFIYLSISA